MGEQVELNGTESALVVAAMFMLGNWPFESQEARAVLGDGDRSLAVELGDRISSRWRHLLSSVGLWESPTGPWSRDLIAQRGALKHGLRLEADELPSVILALRALVAEFARNWGELCVAAPGAVDWYGVGSSDLQRLAERLHRGLGS